MKLKLIDKSKLIAIDKKTHVANVRLNSGVKRLIDQHFKSVSKYFNYKLKLLKNGNRPRSIPGPKATQLLKDSQTIVRYPDNYSDLLLKKGYTAQTFLDACLNASVEIINN